MRRRLSTLLSLYSRGSLAALLRSSGELTRAQRAHLVAVYGHIRALAWTTPAQLTDVEGISHPTAVRLCVAAQRAAGRQ